DGRADVAAPAAPTAPPATPDVRPEAGTETRARPEVGPEAVPGSAPVGAAIEVPRTPAGSVRVTVVLVDVLHVFSLLGLLVSYVIDDISTMYPTQGFGLCVPRLTGSNPD